MSKTLKIQIGLFIAALLIIGITVKSKEYNGSSDKEITSEITPSYATIKTFISTTGTVQPQNRLEIKPPISGRIEEILVKEGEKVKTGKTLAWMSSTERAALLDTSRAQGEESLKYWENAYKATPLIAPIDGEVIVRAVEPGQTVTSSDAVIVLSDRLIVKAQVDETDIGKVKLGQKAFIGLDAYPEIKAEAVVDHISYESKIVNNVTIYEVDILPKEAPGVFRSGMSANVDIVENAKDNILVIPLEAVNEDKEGRFVILKQAKGKIIRQKIELGISDEKNVEVTSGLTPEDTIIVKTRKYSPSKNSNSKSSPFMPFGGRRR